jgi:hypothetical protein
MTAKVDSAAVQDGFDIYHHSFFLAADGEWAVVQQGMRDDDGTARRYHWLGARVSDFVNEPHAAVAGDTPPEPVLNMVAWESDAARSAAAEFARADRATYDETIEWLRDAVDKARVGRSERLDALRRLAEFTTLPEPNDR